MKLNARHLILDLLLAAPDHILTAKEAITACRIFDISENSVRVALVRLSSEGLIEGAGRGSYRLAAQALELADDVATWRQAEQRVRPWQGDWIVAFTANLGRSDRAALGRRERALSLLGFAELEKGLSIRPNNIEQDINAVRKRLVQLGLEPDAHVFVAQSWSEAQTHRIHQLWDGSALNINYRRQTQQLRDWMHRAHELEPDVAARECFLHGDKAIKQVIFDPLLPESLVDVPLRRTFVETVREFDQLGHRIWRQLYDQ